MPIYEFMPEIKLVLFLLIIGLGVRSAWFLTARIFGRYNPEHYHRWLVIPWRGLIRYQSRFGDWREEVFRIGKTSTASWASALSLLALVYRPKDIPIGRLRLAGFGLLQPHGIEPERHLAILAGTGAGKTALLGTMIALHRGNVCVVDPKAQLVKVLARRRGNGGDGVRGLCKNIGILDPYRLAKGLTSSCWNALDELTLVERREGRMAIVKYAMKMAEGLVPMDGDKPYFPKTAREFLHGLILHVFSTETADLRHLVRVRDLATRGYDEAGEHGFKFLLSEMRNNSEFDGVISNAAASLAEAGKSYGDILSTLRSALKFLDIPEIREISRRSDFSLADLKLGSQDLFICAPTSAIRGELSNWFRLITVLTLDLFERIPGNLSDPCLFAIDELPSLGYIEAIETAAPVMRSHGVRLVPVAQDIEGLARAYPKGWKGFLGNADAVFWMGTNEAQTAEYLSKLLGQKSKKIRRGWLPFFSRVEKTEERPLMTSDQVHRFLDPSKRNMIVTRFGKRAMRVKTIPYFRELPVYYYDADPEHQETHLRAMSRRYYATRVDVPIKSKAAYKTVTSIASEPE